MSAFTATQMMVSAPVVAKASAASKAKAVAPKGKVSFAAKVGVSNATEKKTNAFYIWKSQNNKFFETFSYLPPLSDAEVLKQIQYLIRNKLNPCVEFEFPGTAYAVAGSLNGMDSRSSSGYYVNRYWSMWKLPMYGATDAEAVLAECKKCAKAFPNAYVRLVGFSASKQVQMVSFLTSRPAVGDKDMQAVAERSIQNN